MATGPDPSIDGGPQTLCARSRKELEGVADD